MTYKIHEQDGNWTLSQDSPGLSVAGTEIPYSEFKKLAADPASISTHYKRDAKGRIVKHAPKSS